MTMRNVKSRRVVITGLGVISSLGIGWQDFWKNLIAGKSGISKITSFDTSNYDRHYGGEVKNFDPAQFINKKRINQLGRASQMAIAASKLALKDANIFLNDLERNRISVNVGTTTGEIQLLEAYNDDKVKLLKKSTQNRIASFPSNALSFNVSSYFKLLNFNNCFATACSSGNYALAYAFDQVRTGKADYSIVGGADAFSRIVFSGFSRLYAVAPKKCQPFDLNRKGMIPGEGAGVLFVETLESSIKRKVPIYSEIKGYGLSCDAWRIAEPSLKGVKKSIRRCLEYSNVKTSQVDYISAHGTGTRENDEVESKSVCEVFGKKAKTVPVSSIKSMLGHTMGAASAFESIVCCLAIKNKQIPPTINFETKDPNCKIDCVPNLSVKKKIRVALNTSQAFGGNNAAVLFQEIVR